VSTLDGATCSSKLKLASAALLDLNLKSGMKDPQNSCPQHIKKQREKPAQMKENMNLKQFLTVTA